MAIAFGSVASESHASGSTWVIDAPTGVAEGDVLVVVLSGNSSGFLDFSAPLGWTRIGGGGIGDSFVEIDAFYKIAGASEPSTYSFSLDVAAPGVSSMARYTGVDTADAVEGTPASQYTSGTSIPAPSVTTANDGCMLVAMFGGYQNNAVSWTAPDGYDPRSDHTNNVHGVMISDRQQGTAGTTGAVNATPDATTRSGGFHIAFNAAAGGGGGVSTTVGAVSAAASVTGTGRSFAHVVGVSSAIASVAGVGANANAGERETVGTSTGQASVVGVGGNDHFSTGTATGVASVTGVGQSEVLTVGNSAGVASVVGVGEAVIAGQAVGTASGIATVSGVASSIAEAVGTSSGSSDASGVNPQVVVTQRLVVGAGGELSWEDHVKAIHEMRMLEGQVKEKKKELKKVEKQIKVAEKKLKVEKAEGILANLHRLEMEKDELENKIEALEVDLEPLIMAIEKFEIEEDDQEFMMMQ
jgi:hypothetical protein